MNNSDIFFRLLRLGFGTEKADGNCPVGFLHFEDETEVRREWMEIYRLGVRQGVSAILFDGLQNLGRSGCAPSAMMPPKELRARWMADCIRLEKVCGLQYHLASELAGIYAEQGVRTVVLKGIAAGTCYPVPNHRPCGDLDCFLMGDYERGNAIAESVGAKVERGFYKHSHINYKGLEVENHQFCTGIRGSRRVKAFERLIQGLLRDEGTSVIGETRLECPSPMFNALFLTHHSQRHYLSEGIALRHLCDWAMFLRVHGGNVDWAKFRSLGVEYGFLPFADSMTRLSARYLGVPVPDGYGAVESDGSDAYLMDDILGYEKAHEGGSKWKERLKIVKSVSANSQRYRRFSDSSMLRHLVVLVFGFCFDRNPRI